MTTTKLPSDLCTAAAVAERFTIHTSVVYRAHEDGRLPAVAMMLAGGDKKRPLFSMAAAARWAANHATRIERSGAASKKAATRIKRAVGKKKKKAPKK